jgi:hypothetical protein
MYPQKMPDFVRRTSTLKPFGALHFPLFGRFLLTAPTKKPQMLVFAGCPEIIESLLT